MKRKVAKRRIGPSLPPLQVPRTRLECDVHADVMALVNDLRDNSVAKDMDMGDMISFLLTKGIESIGKGGAA